MKEFLKKVNFLCCDFSYQWLAWLSGYSASWPDFSSSNMKQPYTGSIYSIQQTIKCNKNVTVLKVFELLKTWKEYLKY